MTVKAPWFCSRCRSSHQGQCPAKKAPRSEGSWFCGHCRQVHQGGCPNKPKAFEHKRVKRTLTGRRLDAVREQIFIRDSFLCQIHLERGEAVVVELHGDNHGVLDHKIPGAEGGSDDPSNLQTICQECDAIKSAQESARGRVGRKF